MNIRFFKTFCLTCAIGMMALTTTLSAQQNNTQSSTRTSDNQQTTLNDQSKKCIAELSKVVDLNEDQNQKIHAVYLQSEKTLQPVWAKYNQAQMSAVNLEAEMYAAMGNGMTDSQEKLFTAARKSQQDKIAAGTYTSSTAPKASTETSRRATSPTLQQGSKSPSDVFVQTAIIAPMEQVRVAVGLNQSEIAKCEKACQAYHTKLNTVWQEINQIRNQLVTEESKTFEAIARILTQEQLNKWKQHEVSATETTGSSSQANISNR